LAAAYGVAITMTMVITSVLFFVLARRHWKWSRPKVFLICGAFFTVDLAFLSANLTKIAFGGWFPLVVAGIIFLLMFTWQQGRQIVASKLRQRLIPLDMFVAELLSQMPTRVPGTAVFMSSNPIGTPPALRQNVMHNKVLHQTVVILSVGTTETPRVEDKEHILIEEIGEGFWMIVLKYGFMEEPDVPLALAIVTHPQLSFAADDVSYFLGRETLRSPAKPGMARFRNRLFMWMARNAQTATDFFNLPPDRVVEMGTQVEL
jgi:KUP system potassium uptake protein